MCQGSPYGTVLRVPDWAGDRATTRLLRCLTVLVLTAHPPPSYGVVVAI
jgi:hypothetical protein